MKRVDLSLKIEQQEFAELIGVSPAKVSQLIGEGLIARDGNAAEWLLAYCERLREQAAGRGHELTAERAALARSQRVGQELKNAITQGEYAPIGLLSEVLAAASAAINDRFEALRGDMRKRCPDLSETALATIDAMLADARSEWVRATMSLTNRAVVELIDDDDNSAADFDDESDTD